MPKVAGAPPVACGSTGVQKNPRKISVIVLKKRAQLFARIKAALMRVSDGDDGQLPCAEDGGFGVGTIHRTLPPGIQHGTQTARQNGCSKVYGLVGQICKAHIAGSDYTPVVHQSSVIIPAYNEATMIGDVIRAAVQNPLVSEVIVVADGCTDGTAEAARSAGATNVIELAVNAGKGQAMEQGVSAAANDVIVFLDADLRDLSQRMLTDMIRPVLDDKQDIMILHIDLWTDSWHKISPLIDLCGQRCMRKRVWYGIPEEYRRGFRIEIALNFYTRWLNLRAGSVLGTGLWSLRKEAKRGLLQGIKERTMELAECFVTFMRLYWNRKRLMQHPGGTR